MDYFMKNLTSFEVGTLFAIVVLSPPWGRLLAVITVVIFELSKRARGIECTIKKNLHGKIAIVTGGNTGIGKETALALAKQGCEIIIGARNVKKSIAATEEIKKISNNNLIFQIPLDLASK